MCHRLHNLGVKNGAFVFLAAEYLVAKIQIPLILNVYGFRTKGFSVTTAIRTFMVDVERILVVKFKCCVWTAVCFLCTWMQDASCESTFCL